MAEYYIIDGDLGESYDYAPYYRKVDPVQDPKVQAEVLKNASKAMLYEVLIVKVLIEMIKEFKEASNA